MKSSEERDKLLAEAETMLERSNLLRKNAEWVVDQIFKHINKYPDKKIDEMSWDKKEAVFNKLKELEGRLWVATTDLLKLDKEYRTMAEKVNAAFGKTVIPLPNPLTLKDIIENDPPEDFK